MLKRREGYFEFRITPDEFTSETKGHVEITIRDEGFIESVKMMIYQFDRVATQVNLQYAGKAEREVSLFKAEFELKKSGIYWYYFTFLLEGKQVYLFRNSQYLEEKKLKVYPNEYCWKITVKSAILKEHPEWTGRTFYQVMPDRFEIGSQRIIPVKGRKVKRWEDREPDWKPDSDGEYRNQYFYGGNLQGIQEKLPYIKELGVDTLYITPIFKSSSYHHYDSEDYFQIDSMIGTWEDYKSLCQEAQKLGIQIINDMVFNHSSDKHPYFQKAIIEADSPYREYYAFDESGKPVTWYGFKDMPERNKFSLKVQEEDKEVIKKYLENGMSAIRFDLGENLPKEYMDKMGTLKREYPKLIFINEMWGIATDKYNPQIFDGQADSIMNYPMTDAVMRWVRTGNHEHFKYRFERIYGEYPKEVQDRLMNPLASHDTPTAITMLVGKGMNENPYTGNIWDIEKPWRYKDTFDTYGFREFETMNDKLLPMDKDKGEKRLKIAIAIMYTIPGNPSLFMGTENAESGYKDPFCRKPMNWDNPNLLIQKFVHAMGKYRMMQKEILAQGEVRLRKCTEDIVLLERYVENNSIILAVNRTEKVCEVYGIEKDIDKYEVIFQENSTKDKLGEYGILILKYEEK